MQRHSRAVEGQTTGAHCLMLKSCVCVVQGIRTMYTHIHTHTHMMVAFVCRAAVRMRNYRNAYIPTQMCANVDPKCIANTQTSTHKFPKLSEHVLGAPHNVLYSTDICIHHRMCSLTYADCSQCQIAIHVENEYHTLRKIERGSDVFCTSTHIFGYLNNSN